MKKTMAIATASLLGAGSAVALGTGPASALPATDCATSDDHVLAADPLADGDWYMECVPQFGVGKVDFTLEGDVPDDLPTFGEPDATSSDAGPLNGVNGTYFGLPDAPEGFEAIAALPDSQDYIGNMIFEVADVSRIELSAIPADCAGGTYDAAYRVDYLPTTVHFSVDWNGETYEATVTAEPEPLYLALNFAGAAFDPAGNQCVSTGVPGDFLFADGAGDVDFTAITQFNGVALDPFPADPSFDLGAFPIAAVVEPTTPPTPPAPPAPAPEEPELAATGLETAPVVGTGISLLALGLLTLIGRRRKPANS